MALPSSAHGFLIMVKYGCLCPSHHASIPASRTEDEQTTMLPPWKNPSPELKTALLLTSPWPELGPVVPPHGRGDLVLSGHVLSQQLVVLLLMRREQLLGTVSRCCPVYLESQSVTTKQP